MQTVQPANQLASHSITTSTPPTPTTNTLNHLLLFELRLGHPADTGSTEIRLFGLDASEAA